MWWWLACVPGPDGLGTSPPELVTCDAPVEGIARFREDGLARGLELDIPPEPDAASCNYTPGGLVVRDLDDDGDIDILVHNHHGVPWIFGNDGAGAFTPAEPGIFSYGGEQFNATAAVDVTGDGLPELFMVGSGLVLQAENLGGLRWGAWEPVFYDPDYPRTCFASLSFGDVDGDCDLDLSLAGMDEIPAEGVLVSVDPDYWNPSRSLLLLNEGGAWDPVMELLSEGKPGFSLTHAFTDRDGDGDLDLMAGTDRPAGGAFPPAAFWRNDGVTNGIPVLVNDAASIGANVQASAMGLGVRDLNRDGQLDYCMSDLAPSLTCLASDSTGTYYEAGRALGLTADVGTHPELPADWYSRTAPTDTLWVTWGLVLSDLDNDGAIDAAVVAGPPPDGGTVALSSVHDWQPDWLWRGNGYGYFQNAAVETGFYSTEAHYGLADADLDGDGFRELIVTPYAGRPEIWNNPCGSGGWLEIRLVGEGGNVDAYGARVTVTAGDQVETEEVHNLLAVSQGPPGLHFGLGDAPVADRVEVRWPDGATTVLTDVLPRQRLTLRQRDAR